MLAHGEQLLRSPVPGVGYPPAMVASHKIRLYGAFVVLQSVCDYTQRVGGEQCGLRKNREADI